MRAVGLDYGSRRLATWSMPPPRVVLDDHVLFEIHEIGVCGTDRELALFHFGYPPEGQERLVLGHEALGRVLAVGQAVKSLQPGDWVTPMVRRPCSPPCPSCARDRRDLCTTFQYTERGIFGENGYFCELAVDRERDLVRVPEEVRPWSILIEPLSAVEKAVELGFRLHQGEPRSALVLGAGPVGMLAALAFQARGLETTVHSLEPATHPRARLLEQAGISYASRAGHARFDLVLEATGSAESSFRALTLLGPLGCLVVLGASKGTGEVNFIEMIRGNHAVAGSVNAAPASFTAAAADLARFDRAVLGAMIERFGFCEYPRTILGQPQAAPKLVHVVADSLH